MFLVCLQSVRLPLPWRKVFFMRERTRGKDSENLWRVICYLYFQEQQFWHPCLSDIILSTKPSTSFTNKSRGTPSATKKHTRKIIPARNVLCCLRGTIVFSTIASSFLFESSRYYVLSSRYLINLN